MVDAFLKHLKKNNGLSNSDMYHHDLEDQGFELLAIVKGKRILVEDLNLVREINDYRIELTPNRNQAAELGIGKYLERIEESAQLEKDVAISTIESTLGTSRRSKLSIIISGIALFVAILFNGINLFNKDNTGQILKKQEEEIEKLRSVIDLLQERQSEYDSLLELNAEKEIESK